jgi:phospholipid/cholesterol/gamma-HCH transport system substrate-binding protein
MSRQTRVGLLVTVGAALFAVALFAIANRSFIFSDTFTMNATFNHVAGLNIGASVQYQGVNVGRVNDIRLPATPGERITVELAIGERARNVIRKNTRSQIKSVGLVGNQIVVLVSPSVPGDAIAEGDTLVGDDPFDLFEITDRALQSVQNFEKAATSFEQIMLDVRNGEGTLGRIIYDSTLYTSIVRTTNESQRVMNSVTDNAQALVELADNATQAVNEILNEVRSGEGTLAKLINDPQLYDRLVVTTDTLNAITSDARAMIANWEQTSNWGALGAYRFAELMEAAKHNWLFRRYFEDRGYLERADFEIRERALEESHDRVAARELELFRWQQRLEAMQAALEEAGKTINLRLNENAVPPDSTGSPLPNRLPE